MTELPHPAQVPGMEESAAAIAHLRRLQSLRDQQTRRKLTDEELAELDEHQQCQHCGGFHVRACPRVRSVSFHPNGKIASVTYWPSVRVDWDHVVFADQGTDDDFPTLDGRTLDDLRLVLAPYSRPWQPDRALLPEGVVHTLCTLEEIQAARRLLLLLDGDDTIQSGSDA